MKQIQNLYKSPPHQKERSSNKTIKFHDNVLDSSSSGGSKEATAYRNSADESDSMDNQICRNFKPIGMVAVYAQNNDIKDNNNLNPFHCLTITQREEQVSTCSFKSKPTTKHHTNLYPDYKYDGQEQDKTCSSKATQPIVTPRKKRNEPVVKRRKKKNKVTTTIDLTHIDSGDDSDNEGLGGAPYHIIRKENKLFYSYDPRGIEGDEELPPVYCQSCRCPRQYCANRVLGRMSAEDVGFLLYRNSHDNLPDSSRGGLKDEFAMAYKRAVHSKMRENRIPFPFGYDLGVCYKLPRCVRKGYLRKFLTAVSEEDNMQEDLVLNGELDATKEELEQLTERYCSAHDGHEVVRCESPEVKEEVICCESPIKEDEDV